MGIGYTCENCGCASGYHYDEGERFGACRVIGTDCKEFIWSDRDYKQYLRRHSPKA